MSDDLKPQDGDATCFRCHEPLTELNKSGAAPDKFCSTCVIAIFRGVIEREAWNYPLKEPKHE